MAVTIIGELNNNNLVPAPGGKAFVDEYGVARATETYHCKSDLALGLVTAITEHPDYPWLARTTADITHLEGFSRVVVSFAGVTGTGVGDEEPEDPEEPDPEVFKKTYRMRNSLSVEPIATHPDFVSDLAGTPESPLNGCTAESWSEDGRFKGFPSNADNDLAGIDSWQVPGVVWEEVYVSQEANVFNLISAGNYIGKIYSSVPGPMGTPGGRNWLLVSVDLDIEGNAYTLRRQWQLSGPKGWNTLIY